jgi:hypothetical protein
MPLDGARAQEQATADLSIRETLFDEVRDLLLLSGELQRRSIDVPARSSSREPARRSSVIALLRVTW